MTNRPPPEDETHVVSAEELREAVLTYLDHMDKREPYANVHADIQQAGLGGPDFTVDRHFDGDGCFAEMERAALRDTGPRPDSGIREAARAAYLFMNMVRCPDCGMPWPEGYIHDGCLSTPRTCPLGHPDCPWPSGMHSTPRQETSE